MLVPEIPDVVDAAESLNLERTLSGYLDVTSFGQRSGDCVGIRGQTKVTSVSSTYEGGTPTCSGKCEGLLAKVDKTEYL